MRKHAVCLIALLVFLVFSLSFVGCAKAVFYDSGWVSESIQTPIDGEIINGTSVTLRFSVTPNEVNGVMALDIESITYTVSLDGKPYITENKTASTSTGVVEELVLRNLAQGEHTVKVDVRALNYFVPAVPVYSGYESDEDSASVNFIVHHVTPQLSISGLDVYKTNQAAFNVTTSEDDFVVSYSYDGGANVTLPQKESAPLTDLYTYNVTLTGLPNGPHTLTVYAKDAFNDSAVAAKVFSVQQPKSLSTIVVIAGAAILAVCTAVLLAQKSRHSARKR
jgi:hypothetical protein